MQQPVRQHNVATQWLRNGAWETNPTTPAGLTTRPTLCFSSDSLQASATRSAASRRRVETVGCGVLSEAVMSDTHADADTHDDSRTDSDTDADADAVGSHDRAPLAVAYSRRVADPVRVELYSVTAARRFRAADDYRVVACDPDAAVEVAHAE